MIAETLQPRRGRRWMEVWKSRSDDGKGQTNPIFTTTLIRLPSLTIYNLWRYQATMSSSPL
ncbi:hypothetical protein E2C01_101996 [Portunus trituberculatus]|uniref:Uncharacterized protein n=1 Tax=Portunus trituberculatus TaxID=210409 RepID=A0A5B7K6Z5_PORTR|nr:hypothetical protein [Portunus trituberculatus]